MYYYYYFYVIIIIIIMLIFSSFYRVGCRAVYFWTRCCLRTMYFLWMHVVKMLTVTLCMSRLLCTIAIALVLSYVCCEILYWCLSQYCNAVYVTTTLENRCTHVVVCIPWRTVLMFVTITVTRFVTIPVMLFVMITV